MKHLVATILLGPLLLLQGRHVRRVTPLLPEPPGPREGRQGAGPPLRLLILGDSAAAGVGAPEQADALSGQLCARLGRCFELDWKLVAQTGATTPDTLQTLASMPAERFDVVVTSLGVNDVTSGRSPKRWIAEQARRDDVVVTAEAFASLNGSPARRLIDPTVDLGREGDSFAPKRWIAR